VDRSLLSPHEDHSHPYPIWANAKSAVPYGYSSVHQYPGNSLTVTARGDIGHAVHRDRPYCAVGRLLSLVPTSGVSSRFLVEFINARVTFASESTGVPQLTGPQIAGYSISMPPSAGETYLIADVLASANALIDSLEQLLTKKRQIKQGAMQELLTGKRRLPGLARPWATRKLGEIATITMGRTPARLVESFWGIGHKWLSIADLKGKVIAESKEEITDAGAEGMEQVPEGTLLMSFKLTIGRLSFAGCRLYTNEAICALRSPQVDKELLYYALSRVDFSLFGKQAVKGYTLNKASLHNVEVTLPSDPEEQRAIALVLADLDTEIAAIEARLTKARSLKQAMAQALLTGRIRLVEPAP
jgi:type I restriction enzyme S subunit